MARGLGEVGVNGVGDHRPVISAQSGAIRGQQLGQPLREEGAIARLVGKHEGVEPGRFARPEHIIATSDSADEGLGAPVLVEIGDAWPDPFRLSQKEGQQNGLAGS